MLRVVTHLSIFCLLFFSQKVIYAERALYVDNFDSILNSASAKTNLLQYAALNNIGSLLLYDLHHVHNQHDLTNPTTNQILADFIADAKVNYNIHRVVATAENAWFFEHRIMAYNATRAAAHEKVDALGMEFEFWTPTFINPGGYYCVNYLQPNGFACDSMGAFAYCKSQLLLMDTLVMNSPHPMTTEMYIGWPNAGQIHQIADIMDKTLIHAYVTNPNTAFNYALTRLQHYNTYPDVEDISIIYSAEPNFMGPWLNAHSMIEAESTFTQDYNTESGTWKNHVNMEGFTYFTYSMMQNIHLPLELIYFKSLKVQGAHYLTWEIARAYSVEGFQIEKSADGRSFDYLDFIPFSDKNLFSYSIEEYLSTAYPGTYYRLKIIDKDDTYHHSNIVFVPQASERLIVLFPNPSRQSLHIKTTHRKLPFKVYNTLGKKIIEGDSIPEMIDVRSLVAGSYWLAVAGLWYTFDVQ